MAATIAKLANYAGSRDVWGGHGVIFLNYTGPSAYANPGGDEIDSVGAPSGNQTGLRNIDSVFPAVSVSGTYFIIAGPSSIGPTKTWNLHWYVGTTGAEVANGVDLSAETAIIGVVGG